MSDKLTTASGGDPSAKTISVPVFHLYHKLLPGLQTQGCLQDDVGSQQPSKETFYMCLVQRSTAST